MSKNSFSKQRIGIMGGSFNPFHNGHIRHALEVMDSLNLSRIELLLSAFHPHKSGLLPFEKRLAYLKSSIKNIPNISVNTMEQNFPPPSYTDYILTAWRKKNNNLLPYFLLGTEDFTALHTWHNGFSLPQIAHLVIVSRFGGDAKRVCKFAKKYWGNIFFTYKEPKSKNFINNIPCEAKQLSEEFTKFSRKKIKNEKNNILKKAKKLFIAIPNIGYCTYLHIPHIEISATRIRSLWKKNKSLRGLVADNAYTLIQKDTLILKEYWK